MQRILITGGTGFIGRHLVARLVGIGNEVHVLARSEQSLEKLGPLATAVEAHLGDLEDAASLRRCVDTAKADIVCHLAARTDLRKPRPDLSDVRQALEVDVLGGLDFLRALAQAEKAARLAASSGVACGIRHGVASLSRDRQGRTGFRLRPWPIDADPSAAVASGPPALSCRDAPPRPDLRPGQSASFLIPDLIETLLKGEPYAIKSGGVTRDLIHVDDVVDAFTACLERPDLAKDLSGEAINISTGRETAMADLGRMIERLIGVDGLVTIGDAPAAGGSARLVAAPDKARERLGWRAAIDLEDGLRHTIDWHRTASRRSCPMPSTTGKPCPPPRQAEERNDDLIPTLVTILVPVFNEEANVRRAYQAVVDVFKTLAPAYRYEIVFTDNHSTDNTYALLQQIAAEDPQVRVDPLCPEFRLSALDLRRLSERAR